ncbi:hypothetical protein AVEN_34741-1 [Araneus ventricosus]|uniref:Ig-like domain-containing protein n=1 Tax=Araneus ventricosus TaxID=182803 RepID=A0A4Y2GVB9_ARAVE|nr:hypothetical protein AVEN_34741-1 [Araneus ventricosus]
MPQATNNGATNNVSNSVEIRRLSVPRWIQNGTEDSVVLDCEYVYNENDLRLVVKWFFEDNLEPVYQWIPELNNRHTSGILKNRLDLDFAVNTADTYSRFRALKIQKPSTELSGKYTCLVTSLAGQDSREQVMTVFGKQTFNDSFLKLLIIKPLRTAARKTCGSVYPAFPNERSYSEPAHLIYLSLIAFTLSYRASRSGAA